MEFTMNPLALALVALAAGLLVGDWNATRRSKGLLRRRLERAGSRLGDDL